MYFEAVFFFYVLLNHLVGYSLFWLVAFCSFFDIIKRNFALTLAKLHFYIDYAVRFFVGKKYDRLDVRQLPEPAPVTFYYARKRRNFVRSGAFRYLIREPGG